MQNCGVATSFVTWAESLSTQKDRIWVLGKDLFFLFSMFDLHVILGQKQD